MQRTICNNGGVMRPNFHSVLTLLAALTLFFSATRAMSQSQPAPAPSKTDDAMELVKQGENLNKEGKPDEAIALYERALQLSPDLYQAQLFLGVALDLQGKYPEAQQHLAKAISLASEKETVQSLRVMAVSFAFQHNVEEAAKYEQRAFDLQYNWKQYADAAATANELARIYLESGDLDNAFQWYQTGRLVGLKKPGITQAEKDLWDFRWEAAEARIAARRGQKEQAQQHLAALKAIVDKGENPDQIHFYPYLAGYVALYTGDYATAIKELQKADQNDAFVLCLLAQTYEKLGDQAHARDYYQKVMTINLHNPSTAFARPLAKEKLAAMSAAPPAQ
jgi:tetratricopeptide (TPR) repeat protein